MRGRLVSDFAGVDSYLTDALLPADPVLEAALAESRRPGLPDIAVSPPQGKLLMLMAQMIGARRTLEIGTLGGYSTIWPGRALPPDGELVTLEFDPSHAEVARKTIARAGLAGQVAVRVGRAMDHLPTLEGPFDFTFTDADKASSPLYFREALRLSRAGSVIVVDNVVRQGLVIESLDDPNVEGIRAMIALIAAEPRVEATAVQTVGSKGWDGFCLIRVVS